MHLKYTAAMVLMLLGVVLAPMASSQTRIVVSADALQAQVSEVADGVVEPADPAQSEDSSDEENGTSPEDELVAKLVEIKFERTPATILNAWSEEHRKKRRFGQKGQE